MCVVQRARGSRIPTSRRNSEVLVTSLLSIVQTITVVAEEQTRSTLWPEHRFFGRCVGDIHIGRSKGPFIVKQRFDSTDDHARRE